MAKNKKQKNPVAAAKPRIEISSKPIYRNYFIIAILLLTGFCYSGIKNNQFTNWDDEEYVVENPLVKSTSNNNLKKIFDTETEVSLNYHPLTVYSLALNYKYSKLSPKAYYITNLIIHLLNTLLVFVLGYLLFNKNTFIGLFCATIFGLHPMHVESVAWIAERKDVLYAFFYILSLILYTRSIDKNSYVLYGSSIMAFILSCLCKAMAASLAPALIVIDIIKNRTISKKLILEKIPFFIIAVLIGIQAIHIQSQGAISDFSTFTLWQRVMFASYGFVMYIVKFFVPLKLSAFYPYPFVNNVLTVTWEYYLLPFIAISVVLIPMYILYNKNKELFKIYIAGMLFYIASVAMVLQFISVGSAIMADRYTYIPYIGLSFVIGYLLNYILEKKKISPSIVNYSLVIIAIIFCFITTNRTKVWANSLTLWNDVIEKYPRQVEVSYKNRGIYYAKLGQFDIAYNDFITAVDAGSKDAGVYSNLGNIYSIRKDFPKALDAYSKSLQYKKDNYDCFVNRGITYSLMKDYNKALSDFAEAEKIKNGDSKLFINRAYTRLNAGFSDLAIEDFTKAIEVDPNNGDYYVNRGIAYFQKNNLEKANNDLEKGVSLNPNNGQAHLNLAIVLQKSGKNKEAAIHAEKAKSLGIAVSEEFINQLKH